MVSAAQFLAQCGPAPLCSAPVMAWLAHRGFDPRISVFSQRRLWRLLGVVAGMQHVMDRLGLVRCMKPQDGDVVAVRLETVGPTLGLCLGDGFHGVVDIAGQAVFLRAPLVAAWEIPCRT